MDGHPEIKTFPDPIDLGIGSPFQIAFIATSDRETYRTHTAAKFAFGFEGKLGKLK
jgi:hypothetical protein